MSAVVFYGFNVPLHLEDQAQQAAEEARLHTVAYGDKFAIAAYSVYSSRYGGVLGIHEDFGKSEQDEYADRLRKALRFMIAVGMDVEYNPDISTFCGWYFGATG